jgi:polysaccharide pyruvyl transferase WcaK-like protein
MINGKKIIEIRKVGFINKGAELMLYTILEKMKKEFPDAEFAMAPSVSTASAPYSKRAELGLYQKTQLWHKGFQFGFLANFIPAKIRNMYGIVLDKEVDIVIDAAGFSYSDQWGKYSCLELADSCKRWKNNGTKVILLPQAFGPYVSKYNQKGIKSALDNADLVFAREKVSYDYLVDLVGERQNLKMAPDFTNLVEGIVPEQFDKEVNRFCIVPNYRMIDKTNKKDSEAYLPFMIEVTRYAYEKGQKPFILVHEGVNDLVLAKKIRDAVSPAVQIVNEANPLKIKGILGVSSGTVGSRFHGLVSALSQGTPALATGWSHKYQMLFEDYGFPEGLINIQMSTEEIHKVMDLIIDDKNKAIVTKTIKQNSEKLKQQSIKMWDDVLAVLKSN